MERRPLGRSGIQVSRLCLGTMTFGEQNDERQAHAQLDLALERGLNFIDTAEIYPVPPRAETQGLTETYIGTWLARRKCRGEVVLATKVAGPADWLPYLRSGPRLVRAHLEQALEQSLQRLQTDYVDLYQVHWPARPTNYFGRLGYPWAEEADATPIHETLEVLDGFVQSGRVRAIGVSNETPWGLGEYLRLAREHGLARVVSIQNPYNLLNRSFEVGLAEFSRREDVGLLAYSPLAFGVLSGKYLRGARPEGARLTLFSRFDRYSNPEAERAAEAYCRLARAAGLSPAQMALAYVTSRPFVTANIIGATTLEQLDEDLGAADLRLPPEVMEAIEAIHRQQPNPAP